MKHLIAATLLAATALTAHMGASAQSRLQATIPFDFKVGENKLPAGTYMINYVKPQTILLSSPQTIRAYLLCSLRQVKFRRTLTG